MTEYNCVYNPDAFLINVGNCIDPSTGNPIPSPVNPTPGAPIIYFNFDVRPNAGSFDIQFNDNDASDDIGWALYRSVTSTTGTGPAPHYQSGDCGNLEFYVCGVESSNSWNSLPITNFPEASNWYLIIWDQLGDNDLDINNFKARFGCGDGAPLCVLNTEPVVTTCNPDGTYTVNVPISGINGNYVGTDPNALNSPSAGVCLTNIGSGGPTTGVISLTYPNGTPYNISIAIAPNGSCVDPSNPNDCTAFVSGVAPNCCLPPPNCLISGASEVCPAATNIIYSGPVGMSSYQWDISGNGTIVGPTDGQSVMVNAAGTCGGGFSLSLTVSDGPCMNFCMLDVSVDDNTPPVVTCPMDMNLGSCMTQDAVDMAFANWLAGFSATDDCGTPTVTDLSLEMPPDICGGSVVVYFTATDVCNNMTSCTATFSITPAPAVVLTCPTDLTVAACQSQADIDLAFANWLATASFSGGCNSSLMDDNTGAPPACGGSTTVTFTANSSCEAPTSCQATFTVTDAPPVILTCPTDLTVAACQTQADIDLAFANWLATASFSDGCNSSLMDDNTGAPPACGGSTTVTFTANSSCEAPINCQATFTVTDAPPVILTCPTDLTVAACQSQADIDLAFANWLATASTNGGCNGALSDNNTGAPPACGGSTTVTFTVNNGCETAVNCMATFSVTAAPAVVLNCPNDLNLDACQTQADVDSIFSAWLALSSANGGCNTVLSNDNTGAPLACSGSTTVTFTATSGCEVPVTCQSTFSVSPAPVIVLTCPNDTTVAACQTQADIDLAFANWLATVSFSGGCNSVLMDDNTGAPLACGGSTTVIFTVISDCEAPATCQATFTVTAAPILVFVCPVDTVLAACQSQADIDAAFAAWLAMATVSGGCNAILTDDNTGAPAACGGTTTVTFTVTNTCQATQTCSRNFTVNTPAPVVLSCPMDVVEAACQSQSDIDTKYANWLNSVTSSGGCNAQLSNNSGPSPDACGGNNVVTFTVTSSCEPDVTCQASFSVTAPAPVVLNCPAPISLPPGMSQAEVDSIFTAWLASASASGGCNGQLTNNNFGPPSACGGSTTVTFIYQSTCAPLFTTCSQTFTVQSIPADIRIAKNFAGIECSTSGVAGNFDVITELIVENTGNVALGNFNLVDNLSAATNLGTGFVGITQAPQVVAVGAHGTLTTADVNPTINIGYAGLGNLLNGDGVLQPGQVFVIQFRFEVNPDAPGAPAIPKNQAQISASGVGTCSTFISANDLSDVGYIPNSTNPGWVGDTGGSNDPTLLTNCWSQLNSSISCNDLLQVSLNQNCEIWLTPGMVLEGEIPSCINANNYPLGSYYEILMVTDAWGGPVADLNPNTPNIHEISGSYIGQYLTVKVQDKVYKNSCWGQIYLEDKLAPVFNCPSAPVTVFCSENLANIPPPIATDNCDPNPVVTLVGNQVIDNDICDDGIYTIRRTYKATDNHGNMTAVNCIQNINVTRPPVDFPGDITWGCTQYNAYPSIVNATKLHPSIVDVDPIELGIDVSPTLPDTTLANTGSGIVNVSVSTICKYNVLHSDQTIGICGTSFKIIRTWTVIDWCTGAIITTGVGGEDNVQVIKVMDKVAPTITRAPFNVSINVPAMHPQPCKSTGLLLPPTISDNCNAVTVQIITTVGEAIYINGVDGKNGGTIPAPGLGIGTHPVTYIATDACGNSTSITVPVTVLDDITPTAVCISFTEVDLPSGQNPTATVLASVFNTGSTDNCCLHHFEVRRMTDSCNDGHDDTVFGPSVVFCCEDVANSPIMVVFRAFDCFGNFNDCMVQVNVNDKQPPVLVSCPPNQRITCDFYADNYETQLAALGNNQTAKSQLLDAQFGQPVFADNCTSMVVTRTYSDNFTQCKEGTITRKWKATDAQGQESDVCTQRVFVDHVSDFVVNFPADITVNCGQSLPNFGEPTVFYETCEMIAVSHLDGLFETVPGACYKFIRTWTVINWCTQGAVADQEVVEVPESQLGLPFPQCDLDGDGDCDNRTFRDSWTATQQPNANQANQQFNPDTDPDTDPWDGFITYQQTIMVIDNVAPVFVSCTVPDVCIQDTSICAATFTIPQPTVMDCSSQVTITANTPGLGSGFGPFTTGPGTFITTFTANDGCNNTAICRDTFEVKDCKAPNIYCAPLVTELMPVSPPMVPVNANQLDAGSTDNCSNILHVSFSPNINDTVMIFMCEDVGDDTVQVWFTDEAGNQDFCETTVTIQDNNNSCDDDTLVVHLGGQIFNENNVPVSGVNVGFNGSNGQVMTGATGSFYFPTVPVGTDVTLVPNKDDNPLEGVSTYDIVKMSQHILNIELLDSPYKMIAADVNNSKTISTFDLVELRKLILHINTDFPSNTSWRFVDKHYVFPVPSNPWFEDFPEIININDLPAEVLDADFVAVKIGDVNASYNFNGEESEERSAETLIFTTKDPYLEAGQTCSLSFRAMDFEVLGYQFTMGFDTDKLEFVEVGEGEATASNFGFGKLAEGAITASWNEHGERNPELADFTLIFRAKTNLRPDEALWLSDKFTKTEAYDRQGELHNIRLQLVENESISDFELFQNRPNPFSKETVIGFMLPAAGKAQLTITDATGKVVKLLEAACSKGYNEFRLSRDELGFGTGILYYRLASGSETATRMMLLTE
ncbi:MAG: hypothetical protein GC192_00585 [Bacteroidetes bacterium]|nr:hypothetical protein [Bacteroidota bacterium]